MKKANVRIKRDYKNCGKPNLLSRGNNVFTGMSGNAYFPNPTVKMDELRGAVDNLETTMIDAQHRDRLKSSIKNAAGQKLIALLDKLANYVEDIANGDEAIILSAGFDISYGSGGNNVLSPIQDFIVENGPNSGQVTLSISKVAGAISYTYYYGIDDGDKTIWFDVPESKTFIVLSDLTPGKTYLFKVSALGTRSKKCQSEIIRKVVF